WRGASEDSVVLSALPMFHVTGMQAGMNAPLYRGATIVVLSRWDRDCAGMQIQRAKVTTWSAITTMLVDFLSNPRLGDYDLSSLRVLGGGGAAMPEALARKLKDVFGLDYVEGYGLSETMAPTHINPPHRPKRQCGGIPIFSTDAGIQEACVIGVPDGYRGETVKAVIVPRRADLNAEEIIEWARSRMAAFKVPRIVQFVDALPKTATGKILWRELQERERAK